VEVGHAKSDRVSEADQFVQDAPRRQMSRLLEARRADHGQPWSPHNRHLSGFDLIFSPHESVILAAKLPATPVETGRAPPSGTRSIGQAIGRCAVSRILDWDRNLLSTTCVRCGTKRRPQSSSSTEERPSGPRRTTPGLPARWCCNSKRRKRLVSRRDASPGKAPSSSSGSRCFLRLPGPR
jgi:hypothetical protein